MRSPGVNYVWVGGFVLAMLAVFVASMAVLTGRSGAVDRYYTRYDNVLGVVPGTQLLYEGLRVGQVEAIEPSREAGQKRYRVTLSVRSGWPIPEDSVAWITEPGLLAAITIDIRAGRSGTLLEPGSEIAGQDLESVFSAVGSLAGRVDEMIEHDLGPLLDSAAERTPRILANLESTTEQLSATTGRVSAVFDAENTAEIDKMIGDLSTSAAHLSELTRHLESSLARVDGMVESVDGLVRDNSDSVERMLVDLEHTLASVARHIDAINANLESTSHNMNEFSAQIRRNPAVLVRGTSGGEAADGDAP
jgi:phospholipid/cholesterol/gamma-HCH transport system substrate-binding protein